MLIKLKFSLLTKSFQQQNLQKYNVIRIIIVIIMSSDLNEILFSSSLSYAYPTTRTSSCANVWGQ